MFRAVHFPSLSSPTFFFSNLRIPALSSFNPHFPSSLAKAPPLFPSLNSTISSPSSSSSPFLRWTPSMVRNPRLQRKVMFSSGSSGREGKEVLVQHLLVGEDNLKLLVELQQRISGEIDLSDLAVEYSICPSKENGGMLGWIRRGQTVPEFEEAAFSAPLNKVVRCKTKFGWHLLQVLSESTREESILQDIEPEELHLKMQDPCFVEEAQLIDVREPEEVAQASLPGFKVLPLRQFGTWGSVITDEFDPKKDTYVLCHHGVRSMQVAKWLQTQGFNSVFNVSGGIHAYALKADSSIPTY
ncbi:rhodanese-like/PpiC domain-containing protein 12, chloroplastic isoform X1 [Typha latifolia]|uniref:rhodanese-like/PpiC domain-containing protein 12, chloroplastic isoform X1 n=1 Tax=Typha latifolia TaxID=4733 RepID=UPI003C2BF179